MIFPDETTFVVSLLQTLLDRAEQPDRQQVIRVRLQRSQHETYWAAACFETRQLIHEQLENLEQRGWIRLHWHRFQEHNWLEAVDLCPEQTLAVYAFLNRIPHETKREVFKEKLTHHPRYPGWHAMFLDWATHQIETERSAFPFQLDHCEENEQLLQLCDSVAQLRTLTLDRALSVHLFQDSKRIDALLPALGFIIRTFDPERKWKKEEERTMLLANNVYHASELIHLSGPLWLETENGRYAIGDTSNGMGVPALSLLHICKSVCTAQVVITIENSASFQEFVDVGLPRALICYTAGFANPALLSLLHYLHQQAPTRPLFHWSDIDGGGFRILHHLRVSLPTLQPLAMDYETLQRHSHATSAMSAKEIRWFDQQCSNSAFVDCKRVFRALIESGQKLEQEAIRPSWCLQQLAQIPPSTAYM